MFADVDFSHPDVREDVLNWGTWIAQELQLAGMRLDAIKHYSEEFLATFVRHLDSHLGTEFFLFGEYWNWKDDVLVSLIQRLGGRVSLIDVQLVYTFSDISQDKRQDLRAVFDGTLVQRDPAHAVVRHRPCLA